MTGHYPDSRICKSTVAPAIIGFVLATMFCNLDGAAERRSLLDTAALVALEVLRPLILAAWQSMPSYFCRDASFLQLLLQIVASIWPLLCTLAG